MRKWVLLRVRPNVAFKLLWDWKEVGIDHKIIARSLLHDNGLKGFDVKQINLEGRPGFCKVTLSCPAVRNEIATRGLTICGQQFNLIFGYYESVAMKMFGCPFSMSDSCIMSAIPEFGNVGGGLIHEKTRVDEFEYDTGMRTDYRRRCLQRFSYNVLGCVHGIAFNYQLVSYAMRKGAWRETARRAIPVWHARIQSVNKIIAPATDSHKQGQLTHDRPQKTDSCTSTETKTSMIFNFWSHR